MPGCASLPSWFLPWQLLSQAHRVVCLPPAVQVGLSRKQIARLIGRVFIQKSAVNLLSTVGGQGQAVGWEWAGGGRACRALGGWAWGWWQALPRMPCRLV